MLLAAVRQKTEPALIESGAARLLDEVFLECHHDLQGGIGKLRRYSECYVLIVALRADGGRRTVLPLLRRTCEAACALYRKGKGDDDG